MRITADTNLLVRATTDDDRAQAEAARRILREATAVAIPVAVFCELSWVLGRGYRYSKPQIGIALAKWLHASTVITDQQAVQDGLDVNALGGDFSDGAVARQGRDAGCPVFASFDRTALKLLASLGHDSIDPLAL